MKIRLDETDRVILRMLQDDGRITNADLARQIGLSPPSMLQRVRKLEESGLIKAYRAILDEDSMGFGLQVLAMISLSLHQEQPIEQFRDQVSAIPEVLECLHVSGEYDFMLRIVAKDMQDYERIVRQNISSIKAVGRINSSFILATPKRTTALPV